ncbi:MAG: cation:proton antiporter [Candidatus Saccharibacteria bacterium]|nr:cation:proton antiporter [Candidatus Saccharibacteria bacterium]
MATELDNMNIQPQALFLVQAIILIAVPFLIWRLRWVRNFAPLVVIQIILGIILGPTVIGHYAPHLFDTLFPAKSLDQLNGLASLGLCLFGLLTGLHFDFNAISRKSAAFVTTSLSTLLLPFGLGAALAIALYRQPYASSGAGELGYVIGFATAIAVTALPVLSAILMELKLINTELGKRVLGYAAINDLSLWIVVACISAFAHQGGHFMLAKVFSTIVLAVIYMFFMLVVVRKFCQSLADKQILTATPSSTRLAMIVGGLLASCLTTELIGIHFMFGAFIFGAVMPKSISGSLFGDFEEFTRVILLPFYFMITGLKISFSFTDHAVWELFMLATITAIVGKVIGTAIPEYIIGHVPARTALKAGVLMQTKGLMEIVVLNILLSLGIINRTVFSALVLMAVATTLLTKPSLALASRLYRLQQSR